MMTHSRTMAATALETRFRLTVHFEIDDALLRTVRAVARRLPSRERTTAGRTCSPKPSASRGEEEATDVTADARSDRPPF